MSNEKKEHPETGSIVSIIINGVVKSIHRGSNTVDEIKKIGEVLIADDLEIIKEGKLIPLSDDGKITIKGGEEFVSHPKSSQSS